MTQTRKPLSVSQYNQYTRCPYSWYLSRRLNAWQRPAAWLGQGSAVHEAAEAWEKSGRTMSLEATQDVFRASYERHINEACETTPNLEYWYASGPYRGSVDIERRYGIGLEQVKKYIDWYTNHPKEVIWIAPDGTPGIEISFDVDLDGVRVRGFIDAVVQEDDEVIVRDNKTGNQPGDDFQLAVYAVALAEQYGIEQPSKGDYWMGRTGKPTHPYPLSDWSKETVSKMFHELEDNIAAEKFDPKPDPKTCMFCSCAMACEFRAD